MSNFGSPPGFIRLILVPVLVLWMAGAGCAFGCQPSKPVDAGLSAASARSPEACEAHGSNACCAHHEKAKHFGSRSPLNLRGESWRPDPTAEGIKRCPMGIRSSAVHNHGRLPDADLVLVNPLIWLSSQGDRAVRTSDSYPVLNRGSTHLLCCVFLI